MRPALAAGLATLFALGAASGAAADPYVYGYGGGGYRFAGPAIEGAYLGAPFTRLPSTSRLVPPAWGYGTYGVPTVAGLPPAPVGTPTVYVIESPAPAARARVTTGPRVLSRTRTGRFAPAAVPAPTVTAGGARVLSVSVPPRHAGLR